MCPNCKGYLQHTLHTQSTSELSAVWVRVGGSLKGRKIKVSLIRTVLIDKSQYLVGKVLVIQTPYTINSELTAHLMTEIGLLKR